MDISEIINYLEDNNLDEVEEIKKVKDAVIIKFYYDFDNEEISAAKSYANEESDFEAESEEWYLEYYIPYLKDISIDNVESIIEDLIEEYEIECSYKPISMKNGTTEYYEFIIAVSNDLTNNELEDILNDYTE